MLKKIFKWTGIGILLLVIGFVTTAAFRQNLKFDAPYPDIHASTDSDVIARGKYLVFGPAHCAECHHSPGTESLVTKGVEVPLSGGYQFNLPIGKVYSKNLTPDRSGIGGYTDQEIARALRYGVRPNGSTLFDFMPFHNTSDEDLTAIISFLRTQQPVSNAVPKNSMNVLGFFVKAFLIKPAGPASEVVKSITKDTSVEYGGYLANSVANCRGCHTNRDLMTGDFIGEDYAGGFKMESLTDPKHYSVITPNLTPDATGKLHGWSQEMFLRRFRQGKVIPHSTMPWGPFSRMSDNELKAIYKYLQTVRPVKNDIQKVLVEN